MIEEELGFNPHATNEKYKSKMLFFGPCIVQTVFHAWGAPVAQLMERASHIQRLRPRCGTPGFKSDLRPPCCLWCPPLSHPTSCHVFKLSYEKAKKYSVLILFSTFTGFSTIISPDDKDQFVYMMPLFFGKKNTQKNIIFHIYILYTVCDINNVL